MRAGHSFACAVLRTERAIPSVRSLARLAAEVEPGFEHLRDFVPGVKLLDGPEVRCGPFRVCFRAFLVARVVQCKVL